MEGISLKLTPVVVKRFLGSLGMFGLLADIYLFDSELLRTVLMEGTTCFKLPTLHQHQTHPTPSRPSTPYTCHYNGCEKSAQNPVVLAS